MSAAVCGVISPLLFTPSVRRMTTRLFASEFCILATAVARPFPIAVPSSIRPVSISFIRFINVALSVVSGHCV